LPRDGCAPPSPRGASPRGRKALAPPDLRGPQGS
jgi:hypothetical protein